MDSGKLNVRSRIIVDSNLRTAKTEFGLFSIVQSKFSNYLGKGQVSK